MSEVTVRDAGIADAPRILEIYRYYVEQTALSFEYETPSLAAFETRMKKTMQKYPYLVACRDGVIEGYEAMEEKLEKMGILNMYVCIGWPPEEEDEYLNRNSAQFHEHMGFAKVGEFHRCGYKFGRWYDMIWMEKIIGEHGEEQAVVQSYKKAVHIATAPKNIRTK